MPAFHIIECGGVVQGRRCTWLAERDLNEVGFRQTVDDILTGQVKDVARVYCINPEEKTCADASEDVALEIMARIRDEGRDLPSAGLMSFLESILGCEAVAKFERAMEAA